MTQKVFTVSPKLSLYELERELLHRKISGAPVIEGGKVVGIISRTDIERAESASSDEACLGSSYYWDGVFAPAEASSGASDIQLEFLRNTYVKEVMTPQVISVASTDSVQTIAGLMLDKKIHRVLVIDDGELRGLVSSLDLVSLLT